MWWPSTKTVRFDGGHLPAWDEHTAIYLDPATGEVLPTWDEALTAIGDHDAPLRGSAAGTVAVSRLRGALSARPSRVRHGGDHDGPDGHVHHDKPGDG